MQACIHAKLPQLCPDLCNPMDCNVQSSCVCGILQVKTLDCVAMPSSRGPSRPGDRTQFIPCIGRRVL